MTALILYSTFDADDGDGDYHRVGRGLTEVYIRVELYAGDIDAALDAATPRDGETVLNSIPAE